jgi:hypothetical protein
MVHTKDIIDMKINVIKNEICILTVKDFYLGFWNVYDVKQLISKLILNMSHKVNGLSCNRCRDKRRSLSLGNAKRQKISVFSVLREARSNGHIFVTELTRVFSYCNC